MVLLDQHLHQLCISQVYANPLPVKTAMNTRVLCGLLLLCLLLLSPVVIEDSQALAVDKKKIMKALFLTKLALKKKKLLVLPMPIPIMVEKKHHEHHIEHHGWDKHHGW